MRVSKYLEDFVWNLAIKGYRYDQDSNMVVPVASFSKEEKQRVYDKKELFGFQSNDEIERAINTILHQNISGEHFAHLSLSQLSPGSRITIMGEYDRGITLLYIDKSSFFVLSDNLNVLHPSDTIELLGGGFSVGDGVVFRVMRNGEWYPSAKHVFDLKIVKSIKCLFPNYINRGQLKQEIKWAETQRKTFAWSASLLSESGFASFPFLEFTEDQNALFLIDLVEGTFLVNPDCDVKKYAQHKINWLERLSMVAEFDDFKEIHWDTIVKALPGTCGQLHFQAGFDYAIIDAKIKLSL